MTKDARQGRSVTATLREDGTVHFDIEREPKPISIRAVDWALAALWLSVGAVLVATVFTL